MSFVSQDGCEQFPSKTYHKYKSQSKTNPLYNKLQNDSGYPQDMLASSCYSRSGKKNYLNLNKQNLKNFFSERLPQKSASIKKQTKTIDPSMIFQIKRRQYELKNETKINLQKTIDIETQSFGSEIKKITENFYVNDKNRDFRKKFSQTQNRTIQPYHSDNFRKGTAAYTQKYSKVLKKQAYDKVFGPDISIIPGRNIRRLVNSASTYRQQQSQMKNKDRKQQTEVLSAREKKRKFTLLISKLDSYRKDFDPENKAGISDYLPDEDEIENDHQSNMITWIQDASKFYRGETMRKDKEKLQSVDDIQKIDHEFYQKMNDHKKSRQRTRQYMIHKQKLQDSSLFNSKMTKFIQKQVSIQSESRQSQSICTIKQQEGNYKSLKRSSTLVIYQRFQKFGKQLTYNYFKAKIFGIKNMYNVFRAFWSKPQPYEIQGSYAFFKTIKNGDVVGTQHFLTQDQNYLYQQDHKGRSPLIYAVIHERRQTVMFLLKLDINIDQTCNKNKTALFHALKNSNMELVRDLLLAGSSPWSSSELQYRNLYEKGSNRKIRILMKNAKKIHLAMSLKSPKSAKLQYWIENRNRINEDEVITFR